MQGSLVYFTADFIPIKLLIVSNEMLDGRNDTALLYAFDERNSHFRSEVGVFAHIFEVPGVFGRAVDVHARTIENVDASSAPFLGI